MTRDDWEGGFCYDKINKKLDISGRTEKSEDTSNILEITSYTASSYLSGKVLASGFWGHMVNLRARSNTFVGTKAPDSP